MFAYAMSVCGFSLDMADVIDAVRPTLSISRLIGLAPFSIDTEQRRLNVSKIALTYTIATLLAYSGASGFILYSIIFESNEGVFYINKINKIGQLGCGMGLSVITLLLTCIQMNRMVSVVHGIQQIDREMVKLNLTAPYQSFIRFSLYQNVGLYIFLALLLVHDCLIRKVDEHAIATAGWFFQFLSNIYNFTMESQFILGALLIKKHFTILNDYLRKFNDPPQEVKGGNVKDLTATIADGGVDVFLGTRLIDPKLIAWDGNFSRLHTAKLSTQESNKEQLTQLAKIKIFRKLHSNLCDVKETLNTAYSLQLLASVAQAFVKITSDLYLLFTTISDEQTSKDFGMFSNPIVWSVTHVLELIFVVITCTKTSKSANYTAVVVHKLLARDCDQDIRNQLKLFSIQLLHRKISFSACGFFTLDMTLLQAIIGAATTYLVILIQFHNSGSSPSTNTTTTAITPTSTSF